MFPDKSTNAFAAILIQAIKKVISFSPNRVAFVICFPQVFLYTNFGSPLFSSALRLYTHASIYHIQASSLVIYLQYIYKIYM